MGEVVEQWEGWGVGGGGGLCGFWAELLKDLKWLAAPGGPVKHGERTKRENMLLDAV